MAARFRGATVVGPTRDTRSPAMSVLVLYASTHGHTGTIAERVAAILAADGLTVETCRLDRHGDGPRPEDHDAVVVGASIHGGHHQGEIVRWVGDHRAALASRPSALLSVSLSAADPSAESQAAAQSYVDELLDQTGWEPQEVALIGGAFQWREYDVFTRGLMRLIARRHDTPVDVSHDLDLTDWSAVERFAHRVGTLAGVPAH
jgi:menaquinone-dependent protoporphyrinogen oxidase